MEIQYLKRVIAIICICAIVYGLFTQFMMIYTGKISHRNHAIKFALLLLLVLIGDYIDYQIEESNNNFLKEHEYIIKIAVIIILLSIYLVLRE